MRQISECWDLENAKEKPPDFFPQTLLHSQKIATIEVKAK